MKQIILLLWCSFIIIRENFTYFIYHKLWRPISTTYIVNFPETHSIGSLNIESGQVVLQ